MQSSLSNNIDRRSFLRNASLVAVALPVFELGTLGLFGCNQARSLSRAASEEQPTGVTWKTTIVSPGEPGEPLIVSGTVYGPDGRTPMEGANLWVYHTDATGVYSPLRESNGDNRYTRLHGSMRTNADGRYEFRTIKPAPYPGHTNPAHIHAFVSGPGYPEYWIDSYLFEEDPFITAEARKKLTGEGSFFSILTLKRGSDDILRGARDIKIERCSKNCTDR
jgi:protocatechuate 3,4-dioxygenase beta subunit